MIAFVIIWGISAIIGTFVAVYVLAALYANKNGTRKQIRSHRKRRTYDDGFGKYTINITETEYVDISE